MAVVPHPGVRKCGPRPHVGYNAAMAHLSELREAARGEPAASGMVHRFDTLTACFDAVVRKFPRRCAIVGSDNTAYTFEELALFSDAVAAAIGGVGAATGDRVCMLTDDEAMLTATLLGSCKAGCMTVKLNSAQPEAYLRSIIEDADPKCIVAAPALAAMARALAGPARRVVEADRLADAGPVTPARAPEPHDPVWIAYTSGSTGRPKGVVHTHCSVLAFVRHYVERARLTTRDRVASLHSLRGMDALSALMTGVTCYFYDPFLRCGFTDIAGWLIDTEATIMPTLPTALRCIVPALAGARDRLNVRLLRLSGEPLTREDLRRAARVFPDSCRVMNWFGSTEVGISSCTLSFSEALGLHDIPAGRVFPGIDVQIEPRGVSRMGTPQGEIVVSGDSLFAGYWRRPDLDAAYLSADSVDPERRRFRTGDVGYFDRSGSLVLAGRADDQLKVNGFRVEPGEVEAALCAQPRIDEAAVRVNGDETGATLVAYVVAASPPPLVALRRALRAKLPAHMVPGYFVRVDGIPKLMSGKPDRRSLPSFEPMDPRDYNTAVSGSSAIDTSKGEKTP